MIYVLRPVPGTELNRTLAWQKHKNKTKNTSKRCLVEVSQPIKTRPAFFFFGSSIASVRLCRPSYDLGQEF